MTSSNIRRFAGLCVSGMLVLLSHHAAMANTVTKTVTNRNGQTFTATRTTSFDASTRTANETESLAGPQGRTATTSISKSPDGRGGVTVTRSFIGFNGQTHTNSHTFGR